MILQEQFNDEWRKNTTKWNRVSNISHVCNTLLLLPENQTHFSEMNN